MNVTFKRHMINNGIHRFSTTQITRGKVSLGLLFLHPPIISSQKKGEFISFLVQFVL